MAERLVRLGPGLAPLVAAQLKESTTDVARQRLLTLRYRLVTSDALALAWPGGLGRLAAMDVNVRHRAAEELIAQAGPDDEALLLELFSDLDPLIREISLRGLITIGGNGATDALVKLLDDPEPNVRAAVLKELAAHPSAALMPQMANYVKREQDPDLLVHAIRFLKTVPGQASIKCLLGLLDHPVWQVRTEATQTLGELARGAGELQKADVFAALIKQLDDHDPFVISRAMEGLKHADLEADVEPLVRVAATHPNLAKDAVDVLVSGTHTRTKAIPALRKFTTDRNPNVRAAAIRGLVEAATADCASELLAAVQDKDSLVRRAAADSLEQIYDAAQTVHRNADRAGSGGIPAEDAPPASSFSFADLMHPADLLQRLRIKKPDESLDPEEAWRQAYRAGQRAAGMDATSHRTVGQDAECRIGGRAAGCRAGAGSAGPRRRGFARAQAIGQRAADASWHHFRRITLAALDPTQRIVLASGCPEARRQSTWARRCRDGNSQNNGGDGRDLESGDTRRR